MWGGSKTGFADPALIIPIDAFVCKQTGLHDFVLICVFYPLDSYHVQIYIHLLASAFTLLSSRSSFYFPLNRCEQ